MKKQHICFLLTLLLSMMGVRTLAHDAEINGIYYNFYGDEAMVTWKNDWYSQYPNRYSGNVVIPSSVTYNNKTYSVTNIEDFAFYNCSDLITVIIPNSVTKIGRDAFRNCYSLQSIAIPNSVTNIGISAFSGCSNLASITVELDNTIYDSRDGCNAIIETSTNTLLNGCKNTIIPCSVTNLGAYAFEDCTSLTSITIPKSVTSMEDWTFDGCSGLTSIIVENGNNIYDSRNNCNAIIETSTNSLVRGCQKTVIPENVTSIRTHAFSHCSSLTSIIIPSSVTSIGDYAFFVCSGLTSITVPNSVTSIGNFAFFDTAWLGNQPKGLVYAGKVVYTYKGYMPYNTYINIPEGILGIGDNAFEGRTNLTSITIPESMRNIGNNAFNGCCSLTSVTIPSSVTSIGNNAFRGCSSLTSIAIPEGVKNIGAGAFFDCSRLISITIPESVTNIKSQTFENCTRLTSIIIPNSVTSIGSSAFWNCSSLTSIAIPKSVTSIEETAFSGCSGLANISVESDNTTYDSRDGCNAIIETSTNTLVKGCKNTVIPSSVTNIGTSAFFRCNELTSIIIPNSVTSIGNGAFSMSRDLASITLSKSVTIIGDGAFQECNNLANVKMMVPEPILIKANTFTNRMNATLHVPEGSLDAYKNAPVWNEFKNIVDDVKIKYRIIYMVDGEEYEIEEKMIYDSITPLAEPTKEGYTFSGWSEIPEIMPEEDVVVVGSFTRDEYVLSESDVNHPVEEYIGDVVLKRTFTNDHWNTLCLPFSMTAEEVKATWGIDTQIASFIGTKYWGTDEMELRFKLEGRGIEAHVPCLIKTSEDIGQVVLTDRTVTWVEQPELRVDDISFLGNYQSGVTVPVGDYYISGDLFYRSQGLSTMQAYRGWFHDHQASSSRRLVFQLVDDEGETTRIDLQPTEETAKSSSYDLRGMHRPSGSQRGMFIYDGKKLMRK